MSIFEYNDIKGGFSMVDIFKALGDENRLRIINLLIDYELCVCEIEVLLKMTQSNASRHLSKLKSVKIINSTKEAQWVHYKLSPEFKNKNKLLFKFLKIKFQEDSLFLKDKERYNKYKKYNMNCQCINEDKDKVLGILDN